MYQYKTEQEKFWAGEFGDEYIKRNDSLKNLAAKTNFFSNILSFTKGASSFIEFGANIGLNLKAIDLLMPSCELSAVEINSKAVENLKKIREGDIKVYHQSIIDFQADYERDFVIACGVLIHINPDLLPEVYDILYKSSKKYILIAEYYNPVPVEVEYRGNSGKLFKRDFAGEMLDKYKDLSLVKYGFGYHRDNIFPQDDITWFLLSK